MINVVCPSCGVLSPSSLTASKSKQSVGCKKCKAIFTAELVRIRAKRSRGHRDLTSHRNFDVRVIDGSGSERLIQFVNHSWEDFELRAKDQVVFVYLGHELRVVQNLTIGVHFTINRGNELMAWIIGIIVAVIVVIVIAINAATSGHHR
jgi:hypothetical protein